MILEICANSIVSALNAQNAKADRIELCSHLEVGGLTPSHGLIKVVREFLDIPVYVLIRPRAGDFSYSYLELEIMKEDIEFCAEIGCKGVVFGCLSTERDIHEAYTTVLMQAAGYMDVTFHRAFDHTRNPFESMEALKEIGVQRILTSGQAKNAMEGLELLGELIEEADDEIVIMPGGGIRPENVLSVLEIGAREVHSSAIPLGKNETDTEMVRELKRLIK